MRIFVLTDNAAGGEYTAEHGLSYLIQTRSGQILFDTGHSDVFLKNASIMGVEINSVGTVVLSHGHWDHGNGLRFLSHKRLICHPAAFIRRYRRNGSENIGLVIDADELRRRFDVVTTETPFPVNEEMTFLGEIPRENDFESQSTGFVDGDGNDDFVPDDSALAVVEDGKLIVVSGCSHAGICNIVEYARQVTGLRQVTAVFGGFHLNGADHQTAETIAYFQANGIAQVYPSHCTQLPALAAFHLAFGTEQVKTGMIFEL
ncbi:MAG: MBL fold metallo-hydrolase [Bacteroidetes bacterium]|nr:MBL fold metallo-hydrolase [Bacteroidota bacterium]